MSVLIRVSFLYEVLQPTYHWVTANEWPHGSSINQPLSYVYHKVTSAYTAAVQLYARSGLLTTAVKVEERQANGKRGYCRLGCPEVEDEHHIFVRCPVFEEWRETTGKHLRKTLEERLSRWRSKLVSKTFTSQS